MGMMRLIPFPDGRSRYPFGYATPTITIGSLRHYVRVALGPVVGPSDPGTLAARGGHREDSGSLLPGLRL